MSRFGDVTQYKQGYDQGYKQGILDVLDKIKAEIKETYDGCYICDWWEDYDWDENDISEYVSVGSIKDVLETIDKYKAEIEKSEVEE